MVTYTETVRCGKCGRDTTVTVGMTATCACGEILESPSPKRCSICGQRLYEDEDNEPDGRGGWLCPECA